MLPNATADQFTERRRELLGKAAGLRTRHFCMVLEDLFDPHNISAIIRSAEVFGIQNVHIIEEETRFHLSKSILKGSFKWMSLFAYPKRAKCMETLKAQGYQIAVASTHATQTVLELDLSKPTAFYMGSEVRGNHPETLAQADAEFILPQYGITESFNVSVASGILMSYLDMFMQQKGRAFYAISKPEQDALLQEWYNRHAYGAEVFSPLQRVE
jgi:tRNA (guanosine-2'-O-)-methyltransferase